MSPALKITGGKKGGLVHETGSERQSTVSILLSLAVVTGTLQNAVGSTWQLSVVFLADDVLVVFAILTIAGRLGAVPTFLLVGIGAWTIWLALAATVSVAAGTVEATEAFSLYRQVCLPALLMLIGSILSKRELLPVLRVTVTCAIANALYVLLEASGYRLIDPTRLASMQGIEIYAGLPANFYRFGGDGAQSIRAGGLLLTPPTTGLLLGVGAVILLQFSRSRARFVLVGLLALGVLLTGSRGGLLILVAGTLGPFLLRKTGKVGAASLLAPLAYVLSQRVASDQSALNHAEGLAGGLRDAWAHPFGRGFGFAGNLLGGSASLESAESLAGIAFSAGGVTCVVLLALILARLWVRVDRGGGGDRAASMVGISAILAALVAETASALNATVALWLLTGAALSRDRESAHSDLVRDDGSARVMGINWDDRREAHGR